MTERIITDSNGRKHITNEPQLHPPQRTWIGLTNDDWDEIFGNALTIGEAIKVTEAKLKAKNFA